MPKRCCIFECTGYHRLYRFPKGEDQLDKKKEWFDAIGLDINSPHPKCLFICDKHFTSDMIGRRHLTFDAVPTINLKPSQSKPASVKCRTPIYYPTNASKPSPPNNATPRDPVPTNSVPKKAYRFVQQSVSQKRFIYVLQPVKNCNTAKTVQSDELSVPIVSRTASEANKPFPDSALAHENTETKVANAVKSFNLSLAASKRPYLDALNTVTPSYKKLLTMPRIFNDKIQPKKTSSSHMATSTPGISSNANLNTTFTPRSIRPGLALKTKINTNAIDPLLFDHSTTISSENMPYEPQNPGTNQPSPKLAVGSLQTEPKTFIIGQPPQSSHSSTNSKPQITSFPPKTTAMKSQSRSDMPNTESESAIKLQSKSKSIVIDNRSAAKPDAPIKLFSVLRAPTNETTIGEPKTILVPSKGASKPQKFVIKRLEVKPVAVTAVNVNAGLREVITGNVTHKNTSIKSTAANTPTVNQIKPVKSISSTASTALKIASVKSLADSNTLVDASEKSPLYDITEEMPTLVSVNTGSPAAISITTQTNPTESSTLILPSSTSITLMPVASKHAVPPISEPIVNHILEPLGTLRRPLAIFAPESKGYRVDVPAIESAINPLEISESTATLAKQVLDNCENIQTNKEEETHMNTNSEDELCVNVDDAGDLASIWEVEKKCKSNARKPQATIDKCVETQPEPDVSKLQKEILYLKEKLNSKEDEITILRSTMLTLAER